MSTPFRELFTEADIDILIEALQKFKNRCESNGTRAIQGYGRVSELEKREEWLKKAGKVDNVLKKVCEEAT
jgi:hypothetical protein